MNYFKHVSKALVVPYGKAYGVLTDREILEKCTLWTSEWLTRLATAVSEMANSLFDNLATVKAYEGKIFEKSVVTFLATKFNILFGLLFYQILMLMYLLCYQAVAETRVDSRLLQTTIMATLQLYHEKILYLTSDKEVQW